MLIVRPLQGPRRDGFKVLCLNTEDCNFQNHDKVRFCTRCGIPIQGTLLQGRYKIQALLAKERNTITLQALDRHDGELVIVRALIPGMTTAKERANFLQDAEMALAFSRSINEPGSIRVIDYGQDGPVAFLVKSEQHEVRSNTHSPYPRMTAPGSMAASQSPANPPSSQDYDFDDEMLTQLRPAVAKEAGTKQAVKSEPTRDWLAEGDYAYELGHYEDALSAYEAALAVNAVAVEAWSGKGATLFHLEYIEEALIAYDHALSLRPEDPDLWCSRANVLHELSRYDEEMYCYEQALAHDPNYVFAWSGRGMTLVELHRPEEALLAFDRALILDPNQSVIWQAMGDTLYSQQRYDEALIAIDRA